MTPGERLAAAASHTCAHSHTPAVDCVHERANENPGVPRASPVSQTHRTAAQLEDVRTRSEELPRDNDAPTFSANSEHFTLWNETHDLHGNIRGLAYGTGTMLHSVSESNEIQEKEEWWD